MPTLTPDQIQQIRKVIADHHWAFVANTVGPEAVPEEILEDLRSRGMVEVETEAIDEAFKYGRHLAAGLNPKLAKMSSREYRDYLKANPLALSDQEREALAWARSRAAENITALSERVRRQVVGEVLENIQTRGSIGELKSNLGHLQEDWHRDWERVAATEKHNAMQHGMASHLRKEYGDDVWVAKRAMGDACRHCVRLHVGPDGHPRIFKLSELEANGTNVGRKAADWLPVVGATHPHCHPPGTRILTARGEVSIEHVRPGDMVLTHAREFRRVTHTWSSFYHGDLVGLRSGDRRVWSTPNHRYLSQGGWIPALRKDESGNFVDSISGKRLLTLTNLDAVKFPAILSEPSLFATVLFGFSGGGVPITAIDFDGDMFIGERKVDEERINAKPDLGDDSMVPQKLVDHALVGRFERTSLGLRHLLSGGIGDRHATLSVSGSASEDLAFRRAEAAEAESIRLSLSAWGVPGVCEPFIDGSSGDPKVASYRLHRKQLVEVHVDDFGYIEFAPSWVARPEVIAALKDHDLNSDYVSIASVRLSHYRGLVYNLTVEQDESYFAEGVASHNCQCQLIRIPDGWGFNKVGELVPGGTYGKLYEGPGDVRKAVLEEDDLLKAFKPQGRLTFQGLPIVIENKAGTYRTWKDAEGNSGKTLMQFAYGYIEGASGADDDELDCFIGPDPRSLKVYVVHQQDPNTGTYDEDKVFLGFPNAPQAYDAYQEHYDRPDFYAGMSEMSVDALKRWIAVGRPSEEYQQRGPKLVLQKAAPLASLSTQGKVHTTQVQSRHGARNPSMLDGDAANQYFQAPHNHAPPTDTEHVRDHLKEQRSKRPPSNTLDMEAAYAMFERVPRKATPIDMDDMEEVMRVGIDGEKGRKDLERRFASTRKPNKNKTPVDDDEEKADWRQ